MVGAFERDVIVVGAGVSGALAAVEILARQPHLDVLLVEQDPTPRDDHTLGWWGPADDPLAELAARSWDRLRTVAPDGAEAVRPLGALRYHVARGVDWDRWHRRALAAAGATLVEGRVVGLEPLSGGTRVLVEDGRAFAARWVLDSRPRAPVSGVHDVDLRQHFVGADVVHPSPVFDPGVPTFMDFRRSQEGALRFAYVLPFSTREALVELVSMGTAVAPQHPQRFVREVLGLPEATVRVREGGVTWMSTGSFPRWEGASLRIGNGGGRLKPSTGYALTRIREDARAIAEGLARHGRPTPAPRDAWLWRWLDRVLLRRIARRPDATARELATLLRRVPLPRLLRFLDQQASVRDVLAVMAALPVFSYGIAGIVELVRWGWGALRSRGGPRGTGPLAQGGAPRYDAPRHGAGARSGRPTNEEPP